MTAASGAAGFPRVFTIPPGAPFLPTLARALLDGALVPGFSAANGPLALSAATVFVPTRRAARALASVLAEQVGAPSVVLPRILPLGDLDTMETELIFDASGFDDPLRADLPTAIGDTARRVILTRLILQWAAAVRRAVITVDADGTRHHHPHEDLIVATSAADAWSLSSDLAALSDDLAAEGIGWDRVKPLGTERYDDYWRITLDFLGIVMTTWPAILAGRGEVDGVVRRSRTDRGGDRAAATRRSRRPGDRRGIDRLDRRRRQADRLHQPPAGGGRRAAGARPVARRSGLDRRRGRRGGHGGDPPADYPETPTAGDRHRA